MPKHQKRQEPIMRLPLQWDKIANKLKGKVI